MGALPEASPRQHWTNMASSRDPRSWRRPLRGRERSPDPARTISRPSPFTDQDIGKDACRQNQTTSRLDEESDADARQSPKSPKQIYKDTIQNRKTRSQFPAIANLHQTTVMAGRGREFFQRFTQWNIDVHPIMDYNCNYNMGITILIK